MSASEWHRLLSNPQAVEELFDTPPDLDSCTLLYLHVDERDLGVTLGFGLAGLPDHPPKEWIDKNLNAFEFFLTFKGATALRMDGWHGAPAHHISTERRAAGGLHVEIHGPGYSVHFDAMAVELVKTRAYLASRSL